MAPRVGPRGTTIEKLAQVANGDTTPVTNPNRGGYTFTRRFPGVTPMPAGTTGESVLNQIIGGPSSGYGQKYGGWQNMDTLKAAVLGQAYRLPSYTAELAAQAAANRAAIEQEMLNQSVPTRPGSMAYEEAIRMSEAGRSRFADDAAYQAAMENLAGIRAQERRYAGAAPFIQAGQEYLAGRAQAVAAPGSAQRDLGTRADIMQLRNVGAAPTQAQSAALQLARQKAEEDLRAAGYAASMERLNAVTPLTPMQYVEDTRTTQYGPKAPYGVSPLEFSKFGEPVPAGSPAADLGATAVMRRAPALIQQKYEPIIQRDVVPQEELVQQLQNIPLASLAQQIAQQVYGVPDVLSEGQFTSKVDVDYYNQEAALKQAQDRAAGIDPTASTQEIILQTQGPQGLLDYQNMIAQGAIEKANEAVGSAETDAFDSAMLDQYGVTPQVAAGDFPAQTARQYFADANFVAYLDQAKTEVQNFQATSIEEKKNAAKQIAADYIQQTGDVVGGTVLLNSLLSFDYLYTYEA